MPFYYYVPLPERRTSCSMAVHPFPSVLTVYYCHWILARTAPSRKNRRSETGRFAVRSYGWADLGFSSSDPIVSALLKHGWEWLSTRMNLFNLVFIHSRRCCGSYIGNAVIVCQAIAFRLSQFSPVQFSWHDFVRSRSRRTIDQELGNYRKKRQSLRTVGRKTSFRSRSRCQSQFVSIRAMVTSCRDWSLCSKDAGIRLESSFQNTVFSAANFCSLFRLSCTFFFWRVLWTCWIMCSTPIPPRRLRHSLDRFVHRSVDCSRRSIFDIADTR